MGMLYIFSSHSLILTMAPSETEWSLSGQYTSITDLPLTDNGVSQMRAVGKALIGKDRLVNLNLVNKIYVSPRTRAQTTLKLLLESQDQEVCSKLDIDTVSAHT